jgi:hypothetical protein
MDCRVIKERRVGLEGWKKEELRERWTNYLIKGHYPGTHRQAGHPPLILLFAIRFCPSGMAKSSMLNV